MRAQAVLPLFVFGLIACLFDGGQVLSVLTLARWETLLVLVPLVLAAAQWDLEAEVNLTKTNTPPNS